MKAYSTRKRCTRPASDKNWECIQRIINKNKYHAVLINYYYEWKGKKEFIII